MTEVRKGEKRRENDGRFRFLFHSNLRWCVSEHRLCDTHQIPQLQPLLGDAAL